MPGRGWGRGVGRRPGEKGLEAGRRLGLHDVPGGAARGGPAYVVSMRDAVASLGAARPVDQVVLHVDCCRGSGRAKPVFLSSKWPPPPVRREGSVGGERPARV